MLLHRAIALRVPVRSLRIVAMAAAVSPLRLARLDSLPSLLRRIGLGLTWLLGVTVASAHPIHTSFAEADYNPTAKTLEVAVRVFADDLEAALAELAGKPVSFARTPPKEIDALARAYATAHFTVKTRDHKLASLRWVGRELHDAANEVWLYFEFDLPAGLDGVRLHHALLSDRFSDQLNSVRVRDRGREITLTFLSRQAERLVEFPPAAPAR